MNSGKNTNRDEQIFTIALNSVLRGLYEIDISTIMRHFPQEISSVLSHDIKIDTHTQHTVLAYTKIDLHALSGHIQRAVNILLDHPIHKLDILERIFAFEKHIGDRFWCARDLENHDRNLYITLKKWHKEHPQKWTGPSELLRVFGPDLTSKFVHRTTHDFTAYVMNLLVDFQNNIGERPWVAADIHRHSQSLYLALKKSAEKNRKTWTDRDQIIRVFGPKFGGQYREKSPQSPLSYKMQMRIDAYKETMKDVPSWNKADLRRFDESLYASLEIAARKHQIGLWSSAQGLSIFFGDLFAARFTHKKRPNEEIL